MIDPCTTVKRGTIYDRRKAVTEVLGKNGWVGDYRVDFFAGLLHDFDFIRGVEVGVDHGRFLFPLSFLLGRYIDVFYGVDPYRVFRSYRPKWQQDQWDNLYVRVLQTAFELRENIIIVRATSEEAACTLPDDFNFVYLDGQHDYYGLLTDLYLWEEKVADNGIIAGHDYEGKYGRTVSAAVDHYVKLRGRELQLFKGNWWWRVRK
jgi:hypothetical protein